MALIKNITSGSINGIVVTGSLNVSSGITGSLFGTASWAENAQTASYAGRRDYCCNDSVV